MGTQLSSTDIFIGGLSQRRKSYVSLPSGTHHRSCHGPLISYSRTRILNDKNRLCLINLRPILVQRSVDFMSPQSRLQYWGTGATLSPPPPFPSWCRVRVTGHRVLHSLILSHIPPMFNELLHKILLVLVEFMFSSETTPNDKLMYPLHQYTLIYTSEDHKSKTR